MILTVLFFSTLHAQDRRRPVFLGGNPSITIEPEYLEGEMDINVFPLVIQYSLSRRADVRFTAILNYGIRRAESRFSHIGGELALPVFLKKKESSASRSAGIYVAPVLGFTRNLVWEFNNTGLWAEAGYHLLFGNGFAMSFGVQGGKTFLYDPAAQGGAWGNHFGVKIIFGKWL